MRPLLCFASLVFAASVTAAGGDDEFAARRRQMMAEVAALARDTGTETGRPAFDARVMTALGTVPRHRFVPFDQVRAAYDNRPLPIGHGQTISQPYIVALMSDLMKVEAASRGARNRHGLGLPGGDPRGARADGVHDRNHRAAGESGGGAPAAASATPRCERGSATAITAGKSAAPTTPSSSPPPEATCPPPLVRQLKPGGRMVIPVGAPFLAQHLMLVEKRADGSIGTRQILPVRFVPLTGGAKG